MSGAGWCVYNEQKKINCCFLQELSFTFRFCLFKQGIQKTEQGRGYQNLLTPLTT